MGKNIQREIEASVGGRVLKMVDKRTKRSLKKNNLVAKRVYLPNFGIHMNYLEREATIRTATTSAPEKTAAKKQDIRKLTTTDQPTLLFCHGLAGNSEQYASFISSMDIPPHVRILVPDQIGHGKDLERARTHPETFRQPTHESMLESTSEFLDRVGAGSNCNAFGISLGGALVYYLRLRRPDVVQRTVLVSPAIPYCMDDKFIEDVLDGRNKFIAFDDREDLKLMLRDLSTGRDDNDGRKKKDPVPTFFLEAFCRKVKEQSPENHNKEMLRSLLKNCGMTHSGCLDDVYAAETDTDGGSPRLVIWPEKDRIISCEKAKRFFKESSSNTKSNNDDDDDDGSSTTATIFETVPDCGHAFHSDGRMIFDIIEPRVKEYILVFRRSHSHSFPRSGSSDSDSDSSDADADADVTAIKPNNADENVNENVSGRTTSGSGSYSSETASSNGDDDDDNATACSDDAASLSLSDLFSSGSSETRWDQYREVALEDKQ